MGWRGRLRTARFWLSAAAGLVLVATVGMAATTAGQAPYRVEISIHFSHFEPSSVTVPYDRPIEFVIHNLDPIDHEWIVGDAQVHAVHRTGTEAHHGARPNELSIDALATVTTTLTFDRPRSDLTYVCHLPGHEAYGMVGQLLVSAGSS